MHVAPCIYLLHRRADLYRDPLAWRPERWLGELGTVPDAAAWIPFGGGVRRCVGAAFALMELRELLRAVTAAVDLAPARPRGERMRRHGGDAEPRRPRAGGADRPRLDVGELVHRVGQRADERRRRLGRRVRSARPAGRTPGNAADRAANGVTVADAAPSSSTSWGLLTPSRLVK